MEQPQQNHNEPIDRTTGGSQGRDSCRMRQAFRRWRHVRRSPLRRLRRRWNDRRSEVLCRRMVMRLSEHEPVKYDASRLQEHFEALVPFGYENDCGGFGDVVLDVSARKLTVERNDRFEDYTTTTYEV